MQKLRIIAGKVLFWVSWPALFVYLRGSLRSRVVVESDGEILLLRGWYDGAKWSLPGGGVHKGEEPLNSAVRELKEETGIELSPAEMTDLGPGEYNQHGLHFKLQRFGCLLPKRPQTSKQHLEVIALAWFKKEDITPEMVDQTTWQHLTLWKQSG